MQNTVTTMPGLSLGYKFCLLYDINLFQHINTSVSWEDRVIIPFDIEVSEKIQHVLHKK